MTNIRTVAKLANVSVATASRALNKPEMVKEATREKVQQAAKEAGYRPNMMARNFRSKKSYSLLVLVPDLSNPFFSKIISQIQIAAKENGYHLLLGNTLNDEKLEQDLAALLTTHQADGIIQLSPRHPLPRSKKRALPIVNICDCVEDDSMMTISLDNRGATAAAIRHLKGLGHEKIGVIKGPSDSLLTQARIDGVVSELGPLDQNLVVEGDYSMDSGEQAVEQLLAAPKPPTAIFAFNDEMAIGVVHGLKSRGLKVPDDLSVVGFDNLNFARFMDPPLTTIRQPNAEFGRLAVEKLLVLIEGEANMQRKEVLDFDLIIRQSTGPAAM